MNRYTSDPMLSPSQVMAEEMAKEKRQMRDARVRELADAIKLALTELGIDKIIQKS